jgi:cell division protein FtsB
LSTAPAPPRPDSFRPVVGATVLLFVALLGIAAWKGSRDLASAREREHLLETRIEDTQGRIDELRGRIDRLRSDPGTLERLAREDLGMVRPGDVIIELPPEPGSADLSGGRTAPRPQTVASPPAH